MSRLIPRSIEASNDEDIIINSSGWKLKGWSRAGCQTGFILYPHKILLDAGLTSSQKFDHVFITHQHVDHVHNLPLVCSRHKPGTNNVYVPNSSKNIINQYFRLITELSSNDDLGKTDEEILQKQNVKLIGTNPGDIITLEKEGLVVEVLQAHHDVQSNGYGFNTIKKVIKPAYTEIIESKNVPKIKELKAQGIDMYDKVNKPEFVYFCDSTIENLSLHEEWKKYPCIVVECTGLFVNEESHSAQSTQSSTQRDVDNNHTTLLSLKPIMLEHKDKRWILIHISMKMSQDEIKQIENKLKEEGLNIYICKGEM